MQSAERQPLINTQKQTKPKPRWNKKWMVLILVVVLLFTLGAVFHDQIGHAIGVNYSSDSSSELWGQIEKIESKYVPKTWTWHEACSDDEKVKFTFAIKQSNTDLLDDVLMEVSSPKSAKYGKHWTFSDVHEFLKPSAESKEVVYGWLLEWGIEEDDIVELTPNGDFISAQIDIETANAMLNTEFGYWEQEKTGNKHIRVRDDYFVPEKLQEHLDFVSPTLRFPIESHTKTMEMVSISPKDIEADTTYVTPSSLKTLYSIGEHKGGQSDENTQAVASFLSEWFDDDDLSQFWDFFEINPTTVYRHPLTQPDGYGSEAELDVQYITSTGELVTTVVWDIEDDLYFITLLQQIADSSTPPTVVSMSYGGDEQSNGWGYCNRANNEFAKVGLLGVTFFASSGDDGAISSSTETCTTDGSFTPSFPASSPYVTAVGGTYGGEFTSIDADTGEIGWYYSGGGFSEFFPAKEFQSNAVDTYFSTVETLPPSQRYNAAGAAYPDVSAQSVAYVICYEGGYYSVSGTSCSCPSVAGMVAIINDMRLSAGKTRLGWLNPVLYGLYDDGEQSTYFNDVTEGNNMGCDDDGIAFYTNVGWDPVTGLGTLKFERLADELVRVGTTTTGDSEDDTQ